MALTRIPKPTWIPISVFVFTTAVILAIWMKIHWDERQQLSIHSAVIAERSTENLDNWLHERFRVVEHLAHESANEHEGDLPAIRKEADRLLDQYPAIQAMNWVNRDGIIGLVAPKNGNDSSLHKNIHEHSQQEIRDALSKAVSSLAISGVTVPDYYGHGPELVIFFPIIDEDTLQLLGFINGELLFPTMINTSFSGQGYITDFRIRVTAPGGEAGFPLFESSPESPWPYEEKASLTILGETWIISVAPTEARIQAIESKMDYALLFGGLLLAVITSWLLRLTLLREQSLRESREQIARIYTAANDAILILEPNSEQIVEANPMARIILSYDLKELTELSMTALLTAESEEPLRNFLDQVATTGKGFTDVITFRTRSGHLVPVEISASTIQYNQRPHILAMIRDITERKRVESDLRESELRLINAQRVAHVGDWSWTISSNELKWSDEVFRIFGLQPTDSTPDFEQFLSMVHKDDRDFVTTSIEETIEGKKPYHLDYQIIRRDGEIRQVFAQGEVENDSDGTPQQMVGTVQDITDLKQAEDRVMRLQDELSRISRISALGAFAAGLTHEISQPLHAIVNYANGCVRMLESGTEEREKILEVSRRIAHQAGYAGEILRRLKSMMVKGENHQSITNVNDIVEEVGELVKGELRRRGVAIHFELTPDLSSIMVDRVEIQQVLVNLVQNSCEALDANEAENRHILIRSAASENNHIAVMVGDSGSGVRPSALNFLFDSFFTTKSKGMGMGLAISRTIIESHGGKLWYSSDAEYSTIFTFTLPTVVGGTNHDS